MSIAEFDIEGMTCARCATRVEKAVRQVVPASDVQVDLVRERLVLDAIPDASTRSAIEAALERAGYRAILRRPGEAPRRAHPGPWGPLGQLVLGLAMMAVRLPAAVEVGLATMIAALAWPRWLRKGLHDAIAGSPGMDTLLGLGVTTSLALAWLGWLGPHHGDHGHSDASMAVLLVGVAGLGKLVATRGKASAANAIEALARALPRRARVVRHGATAEVEVDEVRPGDELLVGAYEHVPIDGTLLDGDQVELDESIVSGESRPRKRSAGEAVTAGSINLARGFRMRASRAAEDSQLAQVTRLVHDARATRGRVVELADRVASVFVPVVVGVALLTGGMLAASGMPWLDALRRAITVLVVACPCALGLATPVAVTVATGALARAGVLVRDPSVLERAASLRRIVFDKTGTLTLGHLTLIRIERLQASWREEDVLAAAAAVETTSAHPLARAIFGAAMARGLEVPLPGPVHELPGEGIEATVEGRVVRVRAARTGETAVVVSFDGADVARFVFDDALRPEAKQVIARLRRRGLTSTLASGDAAAVVQQVARTLGLDEARGELRPEDKLDVIRSGQRPVAMVGDGVNDTGALAAADVGIAFGARAALPLEAAPVLIVTPELAALERLIDHASRTVWVIRQNLALAFAYNVLAVPFAALGMFDALGGAPMAAVAMFASSLAVVANALRLRSLRGT